VGSISFTRSIFILAKKQCCSAFFSLKKSKLTTENYNISIVVHDCQIRQLSRPDQGGSVMFKDGLMLWRGSIFPVSISGKWLVWGSVPRDCYF